VVAMLLLEPSNFSFITGPTKGCLRTVYDSGVIIKRFRFVNAPELGSPCCFHLWLGYLTFSLSARAMPMERTPSGVRRSGFLS